MPEVGGAREKAFGEGDLSANNGKRVRESDQGVLKVTGEQAHSSFQQLSGVLRPGPLRLLRTQLTSGSGATP